MRNNNVIFFLIVLIIACAERNKIVDSDSEFNDHFTELKGSISGTITYSNSPFLAIDDILIDSTATLIVEPGVRIYFTDSSQFTINGEIIAVGDKDQLIYFTAKNVFWKGIKIENSKQHSIFQFAILEKVFTNIQDSTDYGALEINNSTATIKNCIIRDNESTNGAGIAVIQSEAQITNNIFRNNHVLTFGGAIFNNLSSSQITNNTFYQNYSVNVGAAISLIDPVNDIIQNNIIFNNFSQQDYPQVYTRIQDSLRYEFLYNFISMETPDPKFISDENLRLQMESPCKDNGNPNLKYNDTNGSRNDQGAYGGPDGGW